MFSLRNVCSKLLREMVFAQRNIDQGTNFNVVFQLC